MRCMWSCTHAECNVSRPAGAERHLIAQDTQIHNEGALMKFTIDVMEQSRSRYLPASPSVVCPCSGALRKSTAPRPAAPVAFIGQSSVINLALFGRILSGDGRTPWCWRLVEVVDRRPRTAQPQWLTEPGIVILCLCRLSRYFSWPASRSCLCMVLEVSLA